MIEEVLHYSKVGQGQLTNRPIDMEQLLEGLKNDLVVANDNPDLRLEIIGDTPTITGENTMIFQVFSNLIGNAIKYSSQSTNSKVIVQGEVMDNNRVRYKITVNGVGIKHSEQDQIFSLFRGLAMSRALKAAALASPS